MTSEKKTEKIRIDVLVHQKGLAESRARAQAIILAGNILVDGMPLTKPGTPVPVTADITVKDTNPYVSRGGLKLQGALDSFGLSPEGRICLDVGASTGGFTDCMLQRGAVKVYSVDVGKHQLHPKLRSDPRVVVLEEVNFRYFRPDSLKDPVTFVTIDVSFISLDKILPVVSSCLGPGGQVVAMVKPQFEVLRGETRKGVVKDESLRHKAIEKIRSVASNIGFRINGAADAPIKGPQGNLEHFLWLEKE